MYKQVFKSKKVLTPGGVMPAQVLVEAGVITGVLPYAAEVEGALIDLESQLLMPGVVDPHVHINEPGRTDWEGFDTGTKAAIAGGITTLVDMPLNASPVTTTAAALQAKRASVHGRLHTDCGFWGGIVPGNEKDLAPLAEEGVLGFKAFLTHSGIEEFPNVTEADLRKAMPILARYNLPLLVHCELETTVPQATKGDKRSYQHYHASRPNKWEDDAIALMIRLCEETRCQTHIVHLSSATAIEQIQLAKEKGLPLTVETAQHYLFFSAEEIQDGQTQFKCAPPIRNRANNDLLWQALQDGIIDFVATDHSPALPALKQLDTGDFTTAWGGIASLQFALPVLWTAAKMRNIDITQVARWLCSNPAHLLGKEIRKGKIAAGFAADLLVFNPNEMFTVTQAHIQHKHKITPYLNRQLSGVVQQTYLRGQQVYAQGKFTQLNGGKIIANPQAKTPAV